MFAAGNALFAWRERIDNQRSPAPPTSLRIAGRIDRLPATPTGPGLPCGASERSGHGGSGLARRRLVVESTIANLKCQMRLEDHLAKTPAGLVQRIAQRLLALTIGVLLNTRRGRPPRNLVAYDGR